MACLHLPHFSNLPRKCHGCPKNTFDKKCVPWFYLQHFSKNFSRGGHFQWVSAHFIIYSVWCFRVILTKCEFRQHILSYIPIINFIENSSNGNQDIACRLIKRQRDRQTEIHVILSTTLSTSLNNRFDTCHFK